MSHNSSAAAAASGAAKTDEVNFFFQDEHGQIATMRKPAQVKSEMHSGKSSVVYATSSSARNSVSGNGSGIGTVGRMGAFSQMGSTNQGQFIRLQDNGTVIPKTENTSYTTGSAQKSASGGGGMYDVVSSAERFERFTPNNPIKLKSRLHAIQSNHSTSASSSSVQRNASRTRPARVSVTSR
ncbi:GL11558 [Drosophila persimilis]|uniref:GL11558 n=1 Tax=Drosophila persimilis TaxID=7234 RepID=B4GBN8_DROPE|nr:GL11558 [Drosophila persimilis]